MSCSSSYSPVVSPLPKLDVCPSSSKKKIQKRGAKSVEDGKYLRQQRQDYEKAIRRSKREAVLESKRRILDKLSWAVWSDEEDESENTESVPQDVIEAHCFLLGVVGNGINRSIHNVFHLVELVARVLKSGNATLIPPAVQVLANLTSYDEQVIEALLMLNVLPMMPQLLEHERADIQSSSAQVLSKITAFGQCVVTPVVEAGILPALVSCLYFGDKISQTRATEVVLNLVTNSTAETLLSISSAGISDALSDMLSRHDPESLYMTLNVFRHLYAKAEKFGILKYIFEQSASANKFIGQIIQHENTLVSSEAAHLSETYIVPYSKQDFVDSVDSENLRMNSLLENMQINSICSGFEVTSI
ncbi:Importin subunit alpha-1 [Halotydeus destructor]|nr:Importin subunit alpha-1 [Halotydeus destructor]